MHLLSDHSDHIRKWSSEATTLIQLKGKRIIFKQGAIKKIGKVILVVQTWMCLTGMNSTQNKVLTEQQITVV